MILYRIKGSREDGLIITPDVMLTVISFIHLKMPRCVEMEWKLF